MPENKNSNKKTQNGNASVQKSTLKKIAEIYQPHYMKRPLIYKIYTKLIFMLIISLAWEKFLDEGARGIGFAFLSLGLIVFFFSWFNYLSLDNLKFHYLMKGWQKKKPNTVHWNKDIADFVDEEIVDYNELHDDEKTVISMFSNMAAGLIFIILSLFF